MKHFNVTQMNCASFELGAFASAADHARKASNDRKDTPKM
ncbi:hypothetical protein VDT1_2895 [Vibrio sp. 16]|jgi:hypothetical protein|nr:hypothetical protein VPMS16_2362 [Vibrio sp. 16]CAK4071149.1 hypothetical protein VDT1_2895 [Vibrio sp. 16]